MSRPSANATATATGGTGVLGMLGVAFIVLRLCGVIDWPWWQVLAPFWVPAAIVTVFIIVMIVAAVVASLVDAKAREARWRAQRGVPRPNQHGPAHRWGRRG